MAKGTPRKNWSREETILAYELYCRTPFGRIHSHNPEIVELADLIGRTSGSVALKMSNLARFDPELQKRNITAMPHGSKMDGIVYEEFSKDWQELSYQAQIIKAKLQNKDIAEVVGIKDIESIPPGEYIEQLMKVRVGQYFFRKSVLNSYGNRCCITGINKADLLIASHIKPWAVSDEHTERTNPSNGLCLNALHDRAFDKGLITIDTQYRIIISDRLKDVEMDNETSIWFWKYNKQCIDLPDKFRPGKSFIEYHNDVVFQR